MGSGIVTGRSIMDGWCGTSRSFQALGVVFIVLQLVGFAI